MSKLPSNFIQFSLILMLGLSACAKEDPAKTAENTEVPESGSAVEMYNKEKTNSPTASEMTDATPVADEASHEGQVLRHAVFFSFKEDVSDEEVTEVVTAFRKLPNEIEEIIDFQWGVNNSPEGLDDGFTHCFLLTFENEAGRAAYLPHDAHKAFGDVLRGKNDKVFVVDYWGEPQEPLENELKHAVFFKFKDDAAAEDVKKVEAAFAALPEKIDAVKRFEWGINNSPEKHSHGFTHCFMVSFDSEEGREAYLPHPDHLAFVEILKPILEQPRVLDFTVEGPLKD